MTFSAFFDVIIIGLITVPLLVAYFILRDKNTPGRWAHHHVQISSGIATLFLLFAAIIFYGSFIEPKIIITRHETIDIPAELNHPIRIALFSDIQAGPYHRTNFVQRIVKQVAQENPDLILYPGDFVQNDGTAVEDETQWLTPLATLAQQYPFYAVHGNHEHGIADPVQSYRSGSAAQRVQNAMRALGIIYLDNTSVTVPIHEQAITIFGADDPWALEQDFASVTGDGDAILMLAHNPDSMFYFQNYAEEQGIDPNTFDLIVSGHTHGGQISLPFIGPIGDAETWLPKEHYRGLSRWWNRQLLYVTSGLGESGPRARLFTPPEIVMLTIQ